MNENLDPAEFARWREIHDMRRQAFRDAAKHGKTTLFRELATIFEREKMPYSARLMAKYDMMFGRGGNGKTG